jgi:hypothetical protein
LHHRVRPGACCQLLTARTRMVNSVHARHQYTPANSVKFQTAAHGSRTIQPPFHICRRALVRLTASKGARLSPELLSDLYGTSSKALMPPRTLPLLSPSACLKYTMTTSMTSSRIRARQQAARARPPMPQVSSSKSAVTLMERALKVRVSDIFWAACA